MWRTFLPLVFLLCSMVSCRKKPDPVVTPVNNDNGSLRVTIQNVAGTQPLILNSGWYQNANGDSFQVTMYKYYISNLILVKEDGTEIAEKESYHLIDESDDASQYFTLTDIPEGNYTKLKFLIGVDSARNISGAQTGALDGIHGMFWDWNTGYIMAKLEGLSPQSKNPDSSIVYHTGGFQGSINVLRNVTLDFPQQLQIKSTTIPNAHLKADILEWFQTPNTISINEHYAVMSGKDVMTFADNYANMFTVDHID